MELTEAVRRRRMVRNYTERAVSREVIERIVGVARSAPSAGFAQGQRFVVVTDAERRSDIARIAGEDAYTAKGLDPWLSRAPVHVVLCVDESAYRDRYAAADKRSTSRGPNEWDVSYGLVDAGASLMLLLLAAVDEGLAAGFFGSHRLPGLKELLKIPTEVTVAGLVTIGHAAPDRKSSSLRAGWRPLREVLHWDEWQR